MKEKKTAISALVSVLVILVIVLAAVAGYSLAYPATSTVTITGKGTTSTVTSTAAGSAAVGPVGALKVAMIVPITAADHSWNYQAESQLQLLQKEYGFQLSITENKFDGTSAQPVALQYAAQGYNVIFLQGIQYQVMASSIAPQYPNTMFVCVDCLARNSSNVALIWLDLGGGGFVEGVMAGMMTKTNNLGLIGGGRVPSIWAGHEGFKAGVLYASSNPSAVKFNEKYEAFSWADAAGAQTDATNMYTAGADIVFSSGDGIDVGVVGAAKASSSPVWATNVYSNLSAVDPTVNKVLLGSIVVGWSALYNQALNAYVNGNWHNFFYTANMGSGLVQVQPGPNVPAKVAKVAKQLQSLITIGSITMYFATDPKSGSPTCFVTPGQCPDTSLANAAAQFNYLPAFSSLG